MFGCGIYVSPDAPLKIVSRLADPSIVRVGDWRARARLLGALICPNVSSSSLPGKCHMSHGAPAFPESEHQNHTLQYYIVGVVTN